VMSVNLSNIQILILLPSIGILTPIPPTVTAKTLPESGVSEYLIDMKYFRLLASDRPYFVRVDLNADFAEVYEIGKGWVKNRHYVAKVYFNGYGDLVTETEALATIAEQETMLAAPDPLTARQVSAAVPLCF
jgi:hypothetical protein